MLREHTLSN